MHNHSVIHQNIMFPLVLDASVIFEDPGTHQYSLPIRGQLETQGIRVAITQEAIRPQRHHIGYQDSLTTVKPKVTRILSFPYSVLQKQVCRHHGR